MFAQTPSNRPGLAPERRRQRLREPALHAARRDGDDLRREGIGQGIDQQAAQGVDEAVGALGPVEVQHHYAVLAR